MRKIVVAGNWKMNKTAQEAAELVKEINEKAVMGSNLKSVLMFPPFPYLSSLKELITQDFIHLGAQNVSAFESGAYTGEVSAEMIKSLGIQYVLIGHSERRTLFYEDSETLMKKVEVSLKNGLTPVFCCGESYDERQSDTHFEVITQQIQDALFHLEVAQIEQIIVAYEPVWAIGTGLTASPEQAEEMHAFIRRLFEQKYGGQVAKQMHLLYGGSCNAKNSQALFSNANVDGGLIGGASLNPAEFLTVIRNVNG